MDNPEFYNYIIVGSGIAGLYSALLANDYGSVLVVTKGSIEDCNTRFAQGGIAAPIGDNDSAELHFQDTISAGAGLCDTLAVRILVEEATDRIADLIRLGVTFDTLHGEIALAREAAHSLPRVLHAGGDATGAMIEVILSRRVREAGIRILEFNLATEITVKHGVVTGLQVLDCRTGVVTAFGCRHLVLATGGAGQLFQYTTNPDVATGDGIALAFLAGAEIADMEFFQFHPTALRLPGVHSFLISEAVRGEGGILRNAAGRAFMGDYSQDAELAPRDVVARSIVYEMKKTGADHVFLDVTHLSASLVASRFPQIYRYCLDHGLDITRELIPVAPAAHYTIGGIRVNTWGEASLPGLFAVGEVACTGVHGANRLASNSLLEGLVFGKRLVERTVKSALTEAVATSEQYASYSLPERPPPPDLPQLSLTNLQALLWDKVGIIRSGPELEVVASILAGWQNQVPQYTDRASSELAYLLTCGRLMTEAARLREESRGAHCRTDFPQTSPGWARHILFKDHGMGGKA